MVYWMDAGGVDTTKLQLGLYGKNFRGLHAAGAIKKEEIVLLVPDRYILAYPVVSTTSIGKQIIDKDLRNFFGQHILYVAFLLEQKAMDPSKRHWGPFLNSFPTTFDEFPLFYSKEELDYLEGSPIVG